MEDGVDDEVPGAIHSLVTIGEDFVRVVVLIRYHLMQLSSLKLHLFFIKLILYNIGAPLCAFSRSSLLALVFVVQLTHAYRDALAVVALVPTFVTAGILVLLFEDLTRSVGSWVVGVHV